MLKKIMFLNLCFRAIFTTLSIFFTGKMSKNNFNEVQDFQDFSIFKHFFIFCIKCMRRKTHYFNYFPLCQKSALTFVCMFSRHTQQYINIKSKLIAKSSIYIIYNSWFNKCLHLTFTLTRPKR